MGPWAPVRLSTEHVEFDTCSMETDVQVHGAFAIISKDGLTRIEKDRSLIGIVNLGRFKFLADACTARRIDLEYLCVSMPGPMWRATKGAEDSDHISFGMD